MSDIIQATMIKLNVPYEYVTYLIEILQQYRPSWKISIECAHLKNNELIIMQYEDKR